MGSKRTNRRELLKGGAALAGGVTLGELAASQAQAHDHAMTPGSQNASPMIMGSKELVEYGERSRYVTSVRIQHPPGGRPSPDVREGVPCGVAAAGFGWRDHAIVAPLRGDDPRLLHAGHRSQGAHSDDPRPGGPSADLHHGGLEAPPVRHPAAFHRVCGEPAHSATKDRSGNARDDQLRRMDRRAPFYAAQGVRPERQRNMVRRRRRGGSEGRVEHADRQGDGRLPRRLRHERRGRAAAARVSAAADGPRLRGNFSHQVSAANQGRGPVLHELQRLRASPSGSERAALSDQIGPKSVITFPSGGQQLPGRGFYEISGLAWSGGGAIRKVEVSTDGGKKWNNAELKGTPQRMAHARFGYPWNWDGNETEILSRCTDEIGQVQPPREQVAKYWNKPVERNYRVPGLDNSVKPWKIAKDGSVTNGLA